MLMSDVETQTNPTMAKLELLKLLSYLAASSLFLQVVLEA